MQIDLAPLLKQVRLYMAETGVSPTAFGMEAGKTPNLIERLESGNVTLKTIRRVEGFLAKHLPSKGAKPKKRRPTR